MNRKETLVLSGRDGEHRFFFRSLTRADIETALAMQETIVRLIGDPTVFQPITREELEESVNLDSVYGVFDGDTIAAWSMFIHNRDTDRSLADDASLPRRAVLTFDGVLVSPACRGLGLQRFFLGKAVDTAKNLGASHVLATVAPVNPYSFRNFQKMGFTVMKEYIKYGYPRYLLQKQL